MNKKSVAQQAQTAVYLSPPQGILQRKCACGNQTIAGGECTECAKKKNTLQRKLAIGASNDPLEREADRVADQVMSMPTNSNIGKALPHIQRLTGQPTGQTDTAPASVDRVLANSGMPMESTLRQDMEQRFDHDFSQVRVHSSAAAEQSARDVSAHAYTVGHNIMFGKDRFSPRTNEGRRLIAHELTHVVQQSGADGIRMGQGNGKHGLSPIDKPNNYTTTASVSPKRQPLLSAPHASLQRQPAEQLRPPHSPVRRPPPLRVIEGGLSRATTRTAQRTGWRYFWRAVARRFAVRGAAAAVLAAADGPLPIGDLIAAGLAIWTIWEIVQLWDLIWSEATRMQQGEQQEPEAPPVAPPQPQPETEEKNRRQRCLEQHPYALICDDEIDRDEIVQDFIDRQGYGFDALGECSGFSTHPAGVIDACAGAPGATWHCDVSPYTSLDGRQLPGGVVSIFSCMCCRQDGTVGNEWRGAHWSPGA